MFNWTCPLFIKVAGFAILFEIMGGLALTLIAKDYTHLAYDNLNIVAIQMRMDGNYRKALTLLDLAIKIEPKKPDSYMTRGVIYGLIHQKENGIQDELKAMALTSKENKECLALVHENLACVYSNNKDKVKAEAELKLSLEINPEDPLTAERLATLLLNNKRKSESLIYLAQAKKSYQKYNLIYDSRRVSEKIASMQAKQNILNDKIIIAHP